MDRKTIKIVIISTLFMYIGLFDYSSVTVVLPSLSSALDISSQMTNWISISFLLFCTAFGLTFGAIVPKYGMIKVAKISTVVIIICGLISTLILNPYTIIFARSIQGIFTAAIFLISYLLIIKYVEKEYVGTALGIVTAGGFLSAISAPTIGGILSYYFPPQSIFSFSIPFSIICLILLFTIKEEWKEEVSIDYVGTGLWVIGMILFTYGISFLETKTGIICLIISIAALANFVIYELNIENPLYDFRLLKNKVYAINNYSAMMGCFVKDGMVFVLTLYLQYSKGLTSIETGFLISIFAVTMFISSPISGRLSDKLDSAKLANFGAILMTISTFMICLMRELPSGVIMVSMLILAIGYSLFDTPNKKIILESSKDENLSYVTAFLSTIRDFGMLLPTAVFTFSLGLCSGIRYGPSYWASSSQLMFYLFFAISLSILILGAKSEELTKTVDINVKKVKREVLKLPNNISNTANDIEILKRLRE